MNLRCCSVPAKATKIIVFVFLNNKIGFVIFRIVDDYDEQKITLLAGNCSIRTAGL